jgi:hypothetical protein
MRLILWPASAGNPDPAAALVPLAQHDHHPPQPDPRWRVLPNWAVLMGDTDPASLLPSEPGLSLVAWSGGAGEALFDAHPATWSPRGQREFVEAVERLLPTLQARRQCLWLRPHARHALSDGPSMRRFREHFASVLATPRQPGSLGILPDPVGLLTRRMLPVAADHLARFAEAIEPGPAGVLLAGLLPDPSPVLEGEHDSGPALSRGPLHEGLLSPAQLAEGLRGHLPLPPEPTIWLEGGPETLAAQRQRLAELFAGTAAAP